MCQSAHTVVLKTTSYLKIALLRAQIPSEQQTAITPASKRLKNLSQSQKDQAKRRRHREARNDVCQRYQRYGLSYVSAYRKYN
jgi:hypothetical protein